MPAILPTWPHILFTIIEPITLIAGWSLPFVDLPYFTTGQIPSTRDIQSTEEIHPSSIALAYQLSNLYGLLFILGLVICNSTSELKVLRRYLACLAVADVGHVYFTAKVMGWDALLDVGKWNSLTWGNVALTAFLFFNRLAYFAGLFGAERKGGGRVKGE